MRSRHKKIRLIIFDILYTFFGHQIRTLIKRIQINSSHSAVNLKIGKYNSFCEEIDPYSTIFVNLPTILRWRLIPGKFYRLHIEHEENDSKITAERILAVRMTPNPNLLHDFSAIISPELALNIFGGCLVERISLQKVDEISVSTLSIANEIKVAKIRRPLNAFTNHERLDFSESLQLFFTKRRLLQAGDVFNLQIDGSEREFFRVHFDENSSNEGNPRFVQSDSVKCYQTADVNAFFPGQRINTTANFIPESVHKIAFKIGNIIKPYMRHTMESPLQHANSSSSMGPAVILVAGGADVQLNCLYFWQSDSERSKETQAKVENAFEKAKSFAPCVHWLQNVSLLNNKNGQSADYAHSMLDSLEKCINVSSPNMVIILTCTTGEMAEIPQKLAKLIHFEFILKDISTEERGAFFAFFGKKLSTVNGDWFVNATRGFSLPELNQLLDNATEEAYRNDRATIFQSDLELGISKRNKAIGKLIGVPEIPKVTWEDIGGLEDVKQFISESLKLNSTTDNSDTAIRRSGIVLYGPPGCGKTLIAKAVANQFKMAFLSVKGPELLNQYVGQSEKNLREVFERARKASPSVLFFDELDSLAPNRGAAGDSGGVMDRMVSQLLTELDSIQWRTDSSVFVMAATNRPDLLDPCLLTPGRFDKSMLVKPADDFESKIKILRPICRKINLENGLTVERIAQKCPSIISGAELQSVMSSAAMNGIREAIFKIESCTSPEEREKLAKAEEVCIMERHIDNALSEFCSAFTAETLQRYSALEKEL